MRALGISLCSVALTSIVIGNAYYQKKQFYPSVVYITKSNPSMAVIYIQAFILVLLLGKLMGKLFFGQLRTSEFEHLMERAWYAITETCLAFTVFRDDFNPKFVALFTLLLFLKSFHWLAEDRVDYMERSPVISWLFHIRILSLLLVLGCFDFYFVEHAYQSTVAKGASVQLVFGFEYAILLSMVVNVGIKYVLHTMDLNSEAPWENKAVLLLYTELVMGLIKVTLYLIFVAIMMRIYTLPLFAFRPMYLTFRDFKKAFNDVILSRRAIYNMNTLYPDATAEELQAADNVCIICREEMTSASKKLPCNHIFHTACLRSWFQRQQTCPTCRLNILRTPSPPQPPRPDQRARAAEQAGAPNPFLGPNPFANFANMNPFVGHNPFQHLLNPNLPNGNPQDANAAPNAENAPQAGTSTQSTPNVPPTSPHAPPVFPPFVSFPFMPLLAPPPFPPANLRALSVEELRRMEGNEKENIEARIQCLKNIQVMLDTAVLMMQQYSAAAAISTSMPMPSTSTQPSTSASNGETTNNSSSSADKPNSNGVAPQAPVVETCNNCESNSNEGADAEQSSASSTPLSPDEELRRRRLQRFQMERQQQQQQQE